MDIESQSWDHEESGHSQTGINELDAVVGKGHDFKTVKPLRLIKKIIQIWCRPDGLVLDPFAGSGTTGHAVIELNAEAAANRNFILIEQGNTEKGDHYARSLTADRVKRVITGDFASGKRAPLPGGYRFIELQKEKIDAEAVNALAREEMIDLLLNSYWNKAEKAKSYLQRFPTGTHRHLFALNTKNEGFFLIWDSEQPSTLNRDAFKRIVEEAKQETGVLASVDRAEAWTLTRIEKDSLARAMDGASQAQLARIDAVLIDMEPLSADNPFWQRNELPQDVAALADKIDSAKELVTVRQADAVVAAARLDLVTGQAYGRQRAGDAEAFDRDAEDILGFTLPHDWSGRVQVQGNIERDIDSQTVVLPAASRGENPEFWGVYAQVGDGTHQHLTDFPNEQQADELADKDGKKTYVPATDVDGKHWTTQYIKEDRTKRFAKDSKKEGCFHVVGGMAELAKAPAIVIGEGYATAASLKQSLGFATVSAFDSGNLAAVAQALHQKFPDKPVVIAGDDDRHLEVTQGANPGRTKAEEAAKLVGGKLLMPIFAPGENSHPANLEPVTPDKYREHQRTGKALSDEQTAALAQMKQFTDFNDLANKSALGTEGIDRQVRSLVESVIEKHQVAQAQSEQQEQDRGATVEPEKEKKAQQVEAPKRRRAAKVA